MDKKYLSQCRVLLDSTQLSDEDRVFFGNHLNRLYLEHKDFIDRLEKIGYIIDEVTLREFNPKITFGGMPRSDLYIRLDAFDKNSDSQFFLTVTHWIKNLSKDVGASHTRYLRMEIPLKMSEQTY